MVVEKQVGRFGEMYCGGGVEVLPVGVSVLRVSAGSGTNQLLAAPPVQ